MSLASTLEPFVNSEIRVWYSEEVATPLWQEIPIASITPKTNKGKKQITTNANRAADGTLYGASANTVLDRTYEVKTIRFQDGEATPGTLAVLEDIEEKGTEKISPDDYGFFLFAPPGKDPYTATCSIDDCQGWGGDIDGVTEFTFTLTQQGPPTAYTDELPS
jgi:hypothetical protein